MNISVRNLLFCLVVVVALIGCKSHNPTIQDLSIADYGPMPSIDECMDKLKQFGDDILIDPDSAKYYIPSTLEQGWARINHSDSPIFGWVFLAQINAKNRMGGYVGKTDYYMIYSKGNLIAITFTHTSKRNSPVNYPFGFK